MRGRFTGWHMTALMLAFFGIVIVVNLVMARFAVTTFGGTVVDNSYVASQQYNGWLAQARRQQALGWTASVAVDPDRRVTIEINGRQAGLEEASVVAVATHPLGREPQRDLAFSSVAGGKFVADSPLPRGRWHIVARVRSGPDEARFVAEVTA